MQDDSSSKELTTKQNASVQLRDFEQGLLNFLGHHNLPTESVFVPVNQRFRVLNNIEETIALIDINKRAESIYISKFVAAVASGLFDAALNYLWDETIAALRQRIEHYDISYFFDNAIRNTEKRKDLKTLEDLSRIDDFELIHGAKEIGLISELGFRQLDFIRYMRNWASAAHPNQYEITGIQLVDWLETCIKEVISLPLSNIVVDIKKLLHNIKNNNISESEAREIGVFFLRLSQTQINNLASGFFGIYTRSDTTSATRQNIHRLLPLLWDKVEEQTRQQFGIKYGKFIADNDQTNSRFARQFLELVNGLQYIPDALRAAEIETALENLLSAHREMNNFYNEPQFARQLQRLVGQQGGIPNQISNRFVDGLVCVFLTNGYGVARNAEPIYISLLESLDSKQAFMAAISFREDSISSKLQFPLCERKYRELLKMMKIKVSMPSIRDLIEEMEKFNSLDSLSKDDKFMHKANNTAKILGIKPILRK